jgi:hypothetical protein
VIKPGDSTTIDLEWETRNNENDYHKSATIGTNDPTRRQFTLDVKGKVFPPVMVRPPEMITLNGISNEEVTRTAIDVFSMDRADLKIKKITTSRPEFMQATYRALTEQERKQLRVPGGFRVDLEVKPGLPVARFHEELVIETDHPLRPEYKVTIAGSATGAISVLPSRLWMTDVWGVEGKKADMTMLVRGATPTKWEIAYHPAKIEVTVANDEKEARKGRYHLKVAVPPGTPAGKIEDEIILKTDNPKATVVKIPVTIVISNVGSG